jgi:heat shock protein HslJ
MRALGLSITLALAAGACATAPTASVTVAPPVAPPPGPAPPTLDGKWALAMVRDAPLGTRLGASLRIEADRAEGITACRSWTAAAPNTGMDLRFERRQDQELTCDGNMKAAEDKYLEALAQVRTAQMRAGYLILMDERGRERLYFARGS